MPYQEAVVNLERNCRRRDGGSARRKVVTGRTRRGCSSLIQIDRERFQKLLTALRTAVSNEYKLNNNVTVFNDILDAFRLAFTFYKRIK